MPERQLVINCDDYGSCFSANEGVQRALTQGVATSATLMVPCPWGYDGALRAKEHPEWAVGVHLTLTCEWARYRWRPLLSRERVPGLYDPAGFMWARTADVHSHATAEEAHAECVAQVEQAIGWGLRPSHLDSHMGASQTHPAFYEAYLAVAKRFGLPVRMAGPGDLAAAVERGQAWAAQARQAAADRGIRFTDDLVLGGRRPDEDARTHFLRVLRDLPPGSSEVLFHPAVASDELRAMTGHAAERAADLHLLTEDAEVRRTIQEQGIRLISYRDIAHG